MLLSMTSSLRVYRMYVGRRGGEDGEAARELRLLDHRERHLPAGVGLLCLLQLPRGDHWLPHRQRGVPQRHHVHRHRLGHHLRGRQPRQGSTEGILKLFMPANGTVSPDIFRSGRIAISNR